MRKFITFLLTLLAVTTSRAAENEIFLENGEIRIVTPSDWVILAHSPVGNRTVVAYQIFGNEAEAGTPTSTNLTVSTFALKDTEAAQAFVVPTTRKSQEGAIVREYQGWSIREWEGEQDGAKYQIKDARITNKALNAGILVRLAWPVLEKNPANYADKMNAAFNAMLDSITRYNPETP